MNYSQLTGRLKKLVCAFDRRAKGDHEIWIHSKTRVRTTIPNWGSKDLKPGTVSKILRDLGIRKEDFDKA
ncbi:MAG: type II toxin-antitoxin system HicA family toxin [Dehalococcoidia bacterium]|nr:type II toxin-antitoxin system HicA family toxin [Dehalococcoidia bacterium]MDZ4245758.1 type II toxin-antitoxin system HicA family toxin [Dehalococcoidia bacterium]